MVAHDSNSDLIPFAHSPLPVVSAVEPCVIRKGLSGLSIIMSLTVLLVLCLPQLSVGQVADTGAVETSLEEDYIKEKKHSPKLAADLSAALPGLGQIYNRKYWKVPIIYAGAGALLYSIRFNSTEYDLYKEAYTLRIDGDSTTIDIFDIQIESSDPKYTDESLLNLKDYYRRNRDISYIFTGVLYMLNIVDAAVDGHFFNYEITDDLSLEIHPAIINSGHARTAGIGMILRL